MNFGGVELEDQGNSIGELDQFGPWTDYGDVLIPTGTFGLQTFVIDGASSSCAVGRQHAAHPGYVGIL